MVIKPGRAFDKRLSQMSGRRLPLVAILAFPPAARDFAISACYDDHCTNAAGHIRPLTRVIAAHHVPKAPEGLANAFKPPNVK